MNVVKSILSKSNPGLDDLVRLLNANEAEKQLIFKKAFEVKEKYCSNKVWPRALFEISNVCKKDCYYCGIRKSNFKTARYTIPLNRIKKLIESAYGNNYKSLVIQSGELTNVAFVNSVTEILTHACGIQNPTGITLSCGEQSSETYRKWLDAGAERYLLRIETSNKNLYYKLHPNDEVHNFENRINALKAIKQIGYQTGTGVMIGLPFQTDEDLANDLLFMQELDIDMCGMGPYIEHKETPLYKFKEKLDSVKVRAEKTFLMVALLRIMMKDINIAATTALHSINHQNIVKAIGYGANVIMPNLTPPEYRES
jgi:biotin synthase